MNEAIPLPNVNEPVLRKVVEWCEHHRKDPPQTTEDENDSRKKSTEIDEWDQKFMQVDQEMLFEIILVGSPFVPSVDAYLTCIRHWGFARSGHADIFLIQAANYMDIKPLLDVGCKTVANMIKGKSPEEIRKTFNITNDFTPEEEEQIRRENEWAEDR